MLQPQRLLRFIEGVEQDVKKRQVIAEGNAAEPAMTEAQCAAQAAVSAAITATLVFVQRVDISSNKTEHDIIHT